jgi:hypothetical protein
MMTKRPLFPLADTPDVDLGQAGGSNAAVDETFATAEPDPARQHTPGRDRAPQRRARTAGAQLPDCDL